jgi:hypothetical protein
MLILTDVNERKGKWRERRVEGKGVEAGATVIQRRHDARNIPCSIDGYGYQIT